MTRQIGTIPKTTFLKKEIIDLAKEQRATSQFSFIRPKNSLWYKQLWQHAESYAHRGELGNMSGLIKGTDDVVTFRLIKIETIPADDVMKVKYEVDESYVITGKFFEGELTTGKLKNY